MVDPRMFTVKPLEGQRGLGTIAEHVSAGPQASSDMSLLMS
jgi:hypothetical protein